MTTISKEDYIKKIYKQKNSGKNSISFSLIAQELMVSKAAVSDMIKKLAKDEYITYEPYKGIELLPKGELFALKILRRHRLWELFLIESLNLSWSEVHQEAEFLEHSTSDFLIDKIDEFLKFPSFDPHGEPIPDKNGILPQMPELKMLSESLQGKFYKLMKVNDENPALISFLSKIGLKLYSTFYLTEKLDFDNSIFIELEGMKHALSHKISENISVIEIEYQRIK